VISMLYFLTPQDMLNRLKINWTTKEINTKHSTNFDEFLHALLPWYVYEVPRVL
jgi:hypothetical protein